MSKRGEWGLSIEILALHEQKAIWMAIPRVCTTSIKIAFANLLGIACRQNVHKAKLPYILPQEIVQYPSYWIFTVVRDPRDRLLSAFCGWNDNWKQRGHGLSPDISWEAFVRRICKCPTPTMNKHVAPQTYLLSRTGTIRPDFIGRYENLAADWAVIHKRTGLVLPPRHHHKTEHRPFMEVFTDEQWVLAGTKYSSDICHFGYPMARHGTI